MELYIELVPLMYMKVNFFMGHFQKCMHFWLRVSDCQQMVHYARFIGNAYLLLLNIFFIIFN